MSGGWSQDCWSSGSSRSLHRWLALHHPANQTTFMPADASLTNCFGVWQNVSTFPLFRLRLEVKSRSNEAVESWSDSRWRVGLFYSSSWTLPHDVQGLTSEICLRCLKGISSFICFFFLCIFLFILELQLFNLLFYFHFSWSWKHKNR